MPHRPPPMGRSPEYYQTLAGFFNRPIKAENPFQSSPLVYLPDHDADEITIRSREAVIATGVFAGAEEIIRAGLLDHTHGVQSALEAQKTALVPLDTLKTGHHHPTQIMSRPKTLSAVALADPWISRLASSVIRFHHRVARVWTRYNRTRGYYQSRLHFMEINRLDDLQHHLKVQKRLVTNSRKPSIRSNCWNEMSGRSMSGEERIGSGRKRTARRWLVSA